MDQNTTLPGGYALFKGGFSLYKQHLGTLFALALGAAALSGGASAAGFFLKAAHSVPLDIAFVILVPVWILASVWVTLSMLYVFAGSPQPVSALTALGMAAPRLFPLLWLVILASLVMTGILGLGAALPAFVVGAVLWVPLGMAHAISAAVFVGGVLFLALVFYFGVTFMFSNWAFVLDNARGLKALAASRSLVAGSFGRVFGRFIVFIALSVVVGAIIGAIVGALAGGVIALAFPAHLAELKGLSETLGRIVAQLVLTPVNLGATYLLYTGMKAWKGSAASAAPLASASMNGAEPVAAPSMSGATEAPKTRWLAVMAVVGIVAVPLLIAAAVALAAFGLVHRPAATVSGSVPGAVLDTSLPQPI